MKNKKEVQDEFDPESRPYGYHQQMVHRIIHHFYISGFIMEPYKYTDMIFRIQSAGPEDVIYMHMNTEGGFMDTGVQIINAMRSTQAHVVTSLEGECSSMGTFIFLAGDEFIVHDNSYMMIHNYSGAVVGKGHEQIAALQSATSWSESFLRRFYIPFLSDEEVDRVLNGADIYMHPPEIRERLINMVEILQKESEAEQEPKPKAKRTAPKKKASVRKR
jgi:ATP-dependent protease ClpP protease subunit